MFGCFSAKTMKIEMGQSCLSDNNTNHENNNFLDCDWFKTLLFSTYSLVGQFNKPITFKVVVCIDQTHSKLQFKSTNHNLGSNHHRNSVQCTSPLSVF